LVPNCTISIPRKTREAQKAKHNRASISRDLDLFGIILVLPDPTET
jgi:hypothetical protein